MFSSFMSYLSFPNNDVKNWKVAKKNPFREDHICFIAWNEYKKTEKEWRDNVSIRLRELQLETIYNSQMEGTRTIDDETLKVLLVRGMDKYYLENKCGDLYRINKIAAELKIILDKLEKFINESINTCG